MGMSHQHPPISHLALLQRAKGSLNALAGHGPVHNHRPDAMQLHEAQHLADGPARRPARPLDADAIRDQRLRGHRHGAQSHGQDVDGARAGDLRHDLVEVGGCIATPEEVLDGLHGRLRGEVMGDMELVGADGHGVLVLGRAAAEDYDLAA